MLILLLLQAEFQEVRDFERVPIAGIVVAVEGVAGFFDSRLDLDPALGVKAEGQIRMMKDYYIRVAGYAWDTETESGEDAEVSAWAVGVGWDWFFGAFRDFALDAGVSAGITRVHAATDADRGFLLQAEAAWRWTFLPHAGLRVSGTFDYADLSYHAAETEHRASFTLGAGLELRF
ncbi:MAG TPA: hypothetical protein VF950_23290 [Planctomycetota bacterium]